jgi:hypothetical protein
MRHTKTKKHQIILLLVFYALAIALTPLTGAQTALRKDRAVRQYVRHLNERPERGVQYAAVALVRLASRKTTYRMGEIFSVDLALLNVSDKPVRLLKSLSSYPADILTVRDENGTAVQINPYNVFSLVIVPDDFALLRPGEMFAISLHLLAGCKDKELVDFDQSRQEFNKAVTEGRTEYQRGMFERNLFVNWGDACLHLSRPGKYAITAQIRNDYVVISASNQKIKTAVGSIQSAPLTITISK